MATLALVPQKAGYSVASPGALGVVLDGPRARFRKDVERNPFRVEASWQVDCYGLQYLRSFFKGLAYKGAAPFSIDLVLDAQGLETFIAFFVPGTFQWSSAGGRMWTVMASLEVMPAQADDEYDASLFAVGLAFGENATNGLNLLDSLVNSAWPEA